MERERRSSYTPAVSEEGSIMDLLLEEVGRVPLLTKEQEITLFKAIETGREAETNMTGANGNLHPPDREGMLGLVEEGKSAKKHVILANLRLVISIAKVYQGRGLPLLDLFQGGTKGLIRATEDFDYKRGNKFSTYATFWIRQSVQREAADNGRTIRIPIHSQDKLQEIMQASEKLIQESEREPTIAELSQTTQIKRKRIFELLSAGPRPISLDTPVGEGENDLGEAIPSNGNGNPQAHTENVMLSLYTQELLSLLNAREERVIRMRYGLDGKDLTLQEVADKLGITRERVRQIQEKALAKMKNMANLYGLIEFLN